MSGVLITGGNMGSEAGLVEGSGAWGRDNIFIKVLSCIDFMCVNWGIYTFLIYIKILFDLYYSSSYILEKLLYYKHLLLSLNSSNKFATGV